MVCNLTGKLFGKLCVDRSALSVDAFKSWAEVTLKTDHGHISLCRLLCDSHLSFRTPHGAASRVSWVVVMVDHDGEG
jgi:hypothetical protein